ncbi:mediator of RNA polymerase II transcription subunit 29 isoform X1 [Loxodonta africana]|uniref:mediator of RNA polymerase II transcription subunit 29 isoform X1 n=1 Tax=Loxodonta africana TaxID=9785 RepID=UPI0030D07FF6
MAAPQQPPSTASSAAGVSGPGSAGGPAAQQQPQPPAQLVGPAQSGLLQQQQQDFDPVQRYKLLIPQLKESLQTLMKVAAQNLIQNTNIDNGHAWHMSACPRAATVPSTLRRWCPQPPSQTQYSRTACPTLSTWPSSKPRLPVPRTFTLPCWTAPTRSRARRQHHPQAPGAPSELEVGEWAGLGNEQVVILSSLVSACSSSPRSQQGAAAACQQRAGRASAPCAPLPHPVFPSPARSGLWTVCVDDPCFQGPPRTWP